MSNIFKRLRLIGRREEREEANQSDAEVLQENSSGQKATECPLEESPSKTRDFCHQRPRYRRSARKRLCFASKQDDEPVNSCRKTSQEGTPHANQLYTKESYGTILLKDDITKNEVDGTKGNLYSNGDVDSKPSTKVADDMNESFEVLMPDLLSSNGNDLSTKKINQHCTEATPDPPVLHRMDTCPGHYSLSRGDVDLPAKSPITRSQTRKEEFQLLKLLCSDDDSTTNDPLPLLSLSKNKRSYPAGKESGIGPLRVKHVGYEAFSKNNVGWIERNDLNTPLGESNIRNQTIPLLLSRSTRMRKQVQSGKIKEHHDKGVTVLESESQRVVEHLNEKSARNNAEKQRLGPCKDSNKENSKAIESDSIKEGSAENTGCEEMDESGENLVEPNHRISKPTLSTEAETESDEGDRKIIGVHVGVEEMQEEKGSDSRVPNYQEVKELSESKEGVELQLKSTEPAESTEVEIISDRVHNESHKYNESQQGSPKGLQGEEGNKSREGNEDPCSQEIAEPSESPNVDGVSEDVGRERPDTNTCTIQKGIVAGMQCKGDADRCNDPKDMKSQERTGPIESNEVETRLDKESNESLETGQEGDVYEKQFKEDHGAEETKHASSQKSSKATESPSPEKGSKVDRKSQETSVHIIEEDSSNGFPGNEGKESQKSKVCKITESTKSNKVENHWIGEVTFDCKASVPTGPCEAPISSDLSPTITPRETYEMFAAPNSHGKFNGRWPMSEGTMSHLAGPGGRTRKLKTERQKKVKPFSNMNTDAYHMPMDNLDWSYPSQGDRMFAMTGTVPQGHPQEFSNMGGYYGGVMSAGEQIVFRSSDDLDTARAASSDSGIDSQGAGELENDPLGSKSKNGNEDYRNTAYYREREKADPRYSNNAVFQHHFDGLYMIDNMGYYIPVNHSYGAIIPPPGFQEGPYGHYGYPGPVKEQQYLDMNQQSKSKSGTNLQADEESRSTSDAKQKDIDYQFILDSSSSIPKASAGGDEGSFDKTNKQTHTQEMQDILDALRILLRDAFDPSVSDPGELLAMYGAELVKDEELRLEFIYFCEQLLNYEIMMSQSGGFFPGACGDFDYPYPTPFVHHTMWPPPDLPCPPGWYPNDIAYYYDGESYVPVRVLPDPQGNLRMILPDGHPGQYGPRDYVPIYAGHDGNPVCV